MRLVRLVRVAFALIVSLAAPALGQGLRWDIDSLDVVIAVRPDGALEITETIAADFSREPHHGIFREIPYAYERMGTDFRLRIDVRSITSPDGDAYRYQSSRNDGMLVLKIGDPDSKVSGVQTYIIRYVVQRGLLGFETHDELYWNAIGPGWPVPIQSASCLVKLPGDIAEDDIRTATFVGAYGSSAGGPAPSFTPDGILFELDRPLSPRAALTIVVGWPKGIVETPSASTRAMWFLADNAILLLPIVTFPLLYLLWRKLGRDRGDPRSIVVRYEPPDNLSPAEVGLIADERVNQRDITATVVDLAVRGYLRIEDRRETRKRKLTKGRIHLVRTDKDAGDLRPFEDLVLRTIFAGGQKERKVGDLELEFYKAIPAIKDDLHKSLDRQGYTAGHLAKRRAAWIGFGVLAGIATVAVAVVLGKAGVFAQGAAIAAGILTAIQFPIFAIFMPRKTVKGRRALEAVRGLEEYIERAEVGELEAAARRDRFEKLLPYAMALGLTKVWGDRFRGLFTEPPEWYHYPPGSPFTTAALVSDLTRSSTMLDSAMTAAPRSQSSGSSFGSGGSGFSGGFSGGGGGGGGGGAW